MYSVTMAEFRSSRTQILKILFWLLLEELDTSKAKQKIFARQWILRRISQGAYKNLVHELQVIIGQYLGLSCDFRKCSDWLDASSRVATADEYQTCLIRPDLVPTGKDWSVGHRVRVVNPRTPNCGKATRLDCSWVGLRSGWCAAVLKKPHAATAQSCHWVVFRFAVLTVTSDLMINDLILLLSPMNRHLLRKNSVKTV